METHHATELVSVADQSPDGFPESGAIEPACTIGDVARQFGLTHRTLRFYESRGLIKPVRRGSTRLYGPKHLDRLAVIVKAKKLGLTLTAIGQLIGDQGSEPPSGSVARCARRRSPSSSASLGKRKRRSRSCARSVGCLMSVDPIGNDRRLAIHCNHR